MVNQELQLLFRKVVHRVRRDLLDLPDRMAFLELQL
jgi:hypothetical protein